MVREKEHRHESYREAITLLPNCLHAGRYDYTLPSRPATVPIN